MKESKILKNVEFIKWNKLVHLNSVNGKLVSCTCPLIFLHQTQNFYTKRQLLRFKRRDVIILMHRNFKNHLLTFGLSLFLPMNAWPTKQGGNLRHQRYPMGRRLGGLL